jgi:hypothetical protein
MKTCSLSVSLVPPALSLRGLARSGPGDAASVKFQMASGPLKGTVDAAGPRPMTRTLHGLLAA